LGRREVLRHVRRDLRLATFQDESGGVVGHIGAERPPATALISSIAASGSASPVACVATPPTTSPLRFSMRACPMEPNSAGLAVEPRARVGSAGVGRVRALLAPEAPFAVAPWPRRRVLAVLAPDALQAGPGLEQRNP
jgi:hypothetical protein